MSFIAVTYGYNQFSIFNIKTSTQTLIDNIKSVCLSQIVSALNGRDSSLQKEIDASQTEEENIKKLIKTTEQDLKVEEVKTQVSVVNFMHRSVRLDVVATDSKGKKYDVEVQRDDEGAGKTKEDKEQLHIAKNSKHEHRKSK